MFEFFLGISENQTSQATASKSDDSREKILPMEIDNGNLNVKNESLNSCSTDVNTPQDPYSNISTKTPIKSM